VGGLFTKSFSENEKYGHQDKEEIVPEATISQVVKFAFKAEFPVVDEFLAECIIADADLADAGQTRGDIITLLKAGDSQT